MSSTTPRPTPSPTRGPGCLGAVAAVVLILIAVGPWLFMQLILSDATLTRPGTGPELDALKRESIADFVPEGATRTQSWDSRGKKGVFGGPDSATTVGRRFAIGGDMGAMMRSFVDPATSDGWTLAVVDCSRVRNTSSISFVKHSGAYELDLEVEYEPLSGTVAAVLSVPEPGNGSQIRAPQPGAALIDTGVSRTDPGCLASRRAGEPAAAPPALDGVTLCRQLAAAWPEAVVVPQAELCTAQVAGTFLSVEAVGSTDPYVYEDDRLSAAGDDRRFALVDGGFWVARDDGIGLVAHANTAVVDPSQPSPPSEETILDLAARAQPAPTP